MSDLGYRNDAQANLVVSANSLDEYVRDLSAATRLPRAEYARIGVKVDGEYRQLNANQLQIENEFYSTIRPKRVIEPGERPTAALRRGGVQYIELRALDISPADPVGLNQRQLRFLEVFLIYCLLLDSPPIALAEQERIDRNHGLVARRGREPGLQLLRGEGSVSLQNWGIAICNEMVAVARLLDPDGKQGHVEAVRHHARAIEDPSQTPSAALIAELRDRQQSLANYGLDLARRTREYFLSLGMDLNQHREALATEARESLLRQAQIEAGDVLDFDDYLARYLA
jgi:glutamate--cysteine ligase